MGRILLVSAVLLGLWGCASTVADLRNSAPIDVAKLKGNYKRIMECATAKMTGPNTTPLYFEQDRRATLTSVSQGEFGTTRGISEISVTQIADNVALYELRIGNAVYPIKENGVPITRRWFIECSEGVVS